MTKKTSGQIFCSGIILWPNVVLYNDPGLIRMKNTVMVIYFSHISPWIEYCIVLTLWKPSKLSPATGMRSRLLTQNVHSSTLFIFISSLIWQWTLSYFILALVLQARSTLRKASIRFCTTWAFVLYNNLISRTFRRFPFLGSVHSLLQSRNISPQHDTVGPFYRGIESVKSRAVRSLMHTRPAHVFSQMIQQVKL